VEVKGKSEKIIGISFDVFPSGLVLDQLALAEQEFLADAFAVSSAGFEQFY